MLIESMMTGQELTGIPTQYTASQRIAILLLARTIHSHKFTAIQNELIIRPNTLRRNVGENQTDPQLADTTYTHTLVIKSTHEYKVHEPFFF